MLASAAVHPSMHFPCFRTQKLAAVVPFRWRIETAVWSRAWWGVRLMQIHVHGRC